MVYLIFTWGYTWGYTAAHDQPRQRTLSHKPIGLGKPVATPLRSARACPPHRLGHTAAAAAEYRRAHDRAHEPATNPGDRPLPPGHRYDLELRESR